MLINDFSPKMPLNRRTSQSIRFTIAPDSPDKPICVTFNLTENQLFEQMNKCYSNGQTKQAINMSMTSTARIFYFANMNNALNKLRDFLSEDDIETIDEYFRDLVKILKY